MKESISAQLVSLLPLPTKYAVLATSGKSGSKRLLKLLDLSPATYCRCEPNAMEGSPFHDLPPWAIHRPGAEAGMEASWDRAVAWAAAHMGERDRVPTPPKEYLFPLSRWLQLDRPLRHRKLRRALGAFIPAWRRCEWRLPRFVGDRAALARSMFIFKVGNAPGWVPWLARSRPQVPVLWLLRHPGGFLFSYRERWLRNNDAAGTLAASRERLEEIVRTDARWAARFGDIRAMGVEELELWYWIYSNETFQEVGAGKARFLRLRDEDVVADPVAFARSLYAACGLEWVPRAESYLLRRKPEWQACSAPWRELLAPDQVKLIERLLSTSTLGQLWGPDEVVSRHDYEAY